MFKNFKGKADVKNTAPIKSSVQRNIRAKLVAEYPKLAEAIDAILPKKSQLSQLKCEDRITLYVLDDEVLFFQSFDDPLVPSLRLVHKYPEYFPQVRVDRGAIKFVLSGANIMVPGLTSAGGFLPDGLKEGDVVVITAEGKENAVAIGRALMSADKMRTENKGIGIEMIHYLNDSLWKFSPA